MSNAPIGFLLKPVQIGLENILPSRSPPRNLRTSRKYLQIRVSIEQVDLIEPLSVGPVDRQSGQHVLLDGHIRLIILKELGYVEAPCLISTDDESYTYNNRVNRISVIQEHVMLRRALERGVSTERLASALAVKIAQVEKKLNLLDGICPETTDLLKDRQCSADVFGLLRRMKPTRQIECAELMISANNVTMAYTRALLSSSPPDRLVQTRRAVKPKGLNDEQLGLMQREMSGLQDQYRIAEQTYGEDMLNLVLVRGYVAKLIDNKHVFRYLEQHHALILEQFVVISSARSDASAAS